eukprot:NODE_3294_length_1005_cov_182.300209_g3030_i0.p1 GENE.NODE_3294_length_1005_cov_182.300209_g3030_i0~~NODE_3294_length_1005_cov_182.300209_g3030_i0.p1  ORF type:complete len:282 (-),score=38.85 NODE_3294_length_1005_cov_182.300209_g3030_i0:98-943(-)
MRSRKDEDDPFMMGSSGKDELDPFDLNAESERVRRNLLPLDVLVVVMQYVSASGLLKSSCVNQTWKEAAQSDKAWKVQCKAKWGAETLKEHKSYCKNLGWQLCYFVGICKTMLVNTPDKHALALVPYPGLTFRDLLGVLGYEKTQYFRLSSTSFTDSVSNLMDEMDAQGLGCSGTLSEISLCDALAEPFATIYVECTRPQRRAEEDEAAFELHAKQLEEQVKLSWKGKALTKLSRLPKFVTRRMQSHWISLFPQPRRPSTSVPTHSKATVSYASGRPKAKG